MKKKCLLIRFSSFGDQIQSLFAVDLLIKEGFEVHYLTKDIYSEFLGTHPELQVISLSKKSGLKGLYKISQKVKAQNYDLIYDVHNNLRSRILTNVFLLSTRLFKKTRFIRRPKHRWKRFLFFKLGQLLFSKNEKGALSFITPLLPFLNQSLMSKNSKNQKNQIENFVQSPSSHWLKKLVDFKSESSKKRVCLVPSASWENKKWPLSSWQSLIDLLQDDYEIIILGGPTDKLEKNLTGTNVTNLVGALNWTQSAKHILSSDCVVGGDTGLTHLADYFNKNVIFLMGPSAFGHPTRPESHYINKGLSCQPCSKDGRGACRNKVKKKCLLEITAYELFQKIHH